MKLAGPLGPMPGIDPDELEGLVIDDRQATKSGNWTEGAGLKGFVGYGYVYANSADAHIRYDFKQPEAGNYEIRVSYLAHENRASQAQVFVNIGKRSYPRQLNMQQPPPLENNFISLGEFDIGPGESCSVELSAKGAQGNVHADAVQWIRRGPTR